MGCTADKVIPITVVASDDGFDADPADNASLVYGLRITSSPNPENSPTRSDRSFLVVPADQRMIDMSLYDTDDDDVILTYHDAAVSPDGIISTASIDEDGILSITQNPGGISSELTYGVCNGEDYIPLSITLRAADATPRPPEFIIIPDAVTIPEGTVISPELINFIASDPNGDDALSYRLVDAPDWLEIEPSVDLPSVGRLLGTVPYDVVGCNGGSTSLTFDVQISDDSFADPANTISVQYTMTVTSRNLQGNSDPIISPVLVYKGTSTIDLNAFSFDRDGDSLTYSNPNTAFLVVNSLSPDGMMNVTVPHDPGSSGTMSITMCDGTRFVTRTATLSVPVYEFVDSRDTPSAVEEISGMYFSNDGRQLFQVDSNLDNAYEIIFEQSFDISAPSTENEVFLESEPDAIDVVFDGDGNNMFVVESDGGIFQYALSEPFFLDDGTGTPVITDISSHFAVNPDLRFLNIQGVDFSANGDKMYVVTSRGTSSTDTVYEFTLDTNFAISSISSTQFRNISDRVGVARDIRISDDDAKMFIVDSAGDFHRPSHIVEYTFGSSLDLSTAEFSGIYNIANQREEPVSVEFSANGYKMFVAENDNDNINEYNLGLPFTMLSDTDVILPVDEEFAGIFRKSSLPITVNFSRPMTDFTADDIVLTGSVNSKDPQISNFTGSGASYSFNVERGASDGGVTILIGRGVATDEFGHPNEISRLSSVFIDAPPVPFINSTVPSPTNLLTISYTVEFSDPVGGFNATGIEVTGSAGGIVENFVRIDDKSYTFDVSHSSVDGEVSVFIPAGVADELTVRPSKNLASNRLTHTIDRIDPIPTLTSTSQEDTNSRTIPFTVDFGEPVTGFNHTGIAVTGLAEVDEDSFEAESDSVYNFDVVATADGRVSVQIPEGMAQDAAENENVASGEVARTVDTVRPTVGISTNTTSPTNLASISYTVTFEEEVNDFDAGDIDASIPGSTPTVTDSTLTVGNTQTYVVTHNADEGILTVSIPENIATDNAENNNIASNILVHTIDRIAPTVDGASVSDTDTIILDISESLSESGGVASDFAISGVATNPSVASIDITGSTITLNLDDSITDADLPLVSYTGTAGSIEDLAENPLAAFTNRAVENEIDTTGPVPTLTITSEPVGATHTNSLMVSYMVTFDMDVTGFDRNDIEVEGSADGGNPEVSVFAGSGDTYTFVVERGDSDGNVIVFIPADMAIDGSGNQNVASDRLEIIFDTISPTLTLASTESGDTRLRTIPVNVTFSERVDDFDADDITIVGSATANAPTTNDNILYMFDIVAIADGDVTVSIRENAVRDVADNGNAASGTIAFAVDTERPSVGISTLTTSPTNSESISYTVEFREEVNDFDAGDITASIVGSTPTVTGPISTIGNTQTYIIAHGVNEGVLTVSIPENIATDNAENNNTASNILVHTIDRIAPTVDGASVSDTDTIILDISESLSESGGVASDFVISGVATNPSVASIDITGSTITLNLDDSITDADLPLVSYTGTAGSIEDLAENPLAAFTNRAVENEIDTTGPVPTLTITSEPGAVTHTNSTTVSYMVTFDMDVTGFDEDDIEVEGSANNGNPEASNFVTVDGDEYTFDVERGDSDGNVIVFIPVDRAIDGSGNQNVASNRLEITFDTAPPTATLTSTESGDTRLRIIPVNATFSERVDDFDINDIIIVGSATANTPTTDDNILYMFDVIATADGDVTVSIREDAVRDVTGNRNAASGTIAFAVDTVRPSVEIASSTVTDLPTNLESISYTVTFRESINGFTATDITASIVGSTPTVTGPVLTLGNTQTYIIAHGVNEGVLTVSIPENVATDDAGNNNTASNTLVHTIDRIAPTVDGASVSDTDTIILDISESLSESGGVASDFAVSGVATNPAVASIAVSGSTVTLNLDDSITDADLPLVSYTGTAGSIEDLAENPLAAFTDRAVENEIDTTAPMPTLATVSPPLTNSQTIAFTVDFGEIVTGFDDTSGIRVTGTSGAAASTPTGSGRNYDFTVNRGSLDGTVTVSILAGAARDGDDNLSVASETITITIDTTPPTVTGASVSDTDTIVLEISELLSESGGAASDFAISGVATNPSVSSIDIAGSTITLDLNGLITDADNPVISYTGTAGIEDLAENPLADFANEPATNDIDTTRPTITAFETESLDPTNSQTIMYTVQFSEPVTRFNATGIDVSGTSGGIASEPVGSGRDYDFTVERGSSDGTVIVTILEGAARDADDNISFASSPVEIVIDATPPTVTGAEVVNPSIIRLDISEPVSDINAVASDFAISGAASTPVVSSIAASGSSVELSLAPPLTDADNPIVAYTRTVGGIEDPATNRLADFANQIVTNDIDTTAPVPTISTTADLLTNLAVIPYMVEFTEEVSGFDRNGIDASIDGVPLTASEPIQGEGNTYTFGVTHNVNEGELRVSIRAGAATDMDSNTSTASNTLTLTVDRIAPTITTASVLDTDTIRLVMSEAVFDNSTTLSDFVISGVGSNPAVSLIAVSGSMVDLNLDDSITDADAPRITYSRTDGGIEDLAENPLADFANQIVTNEIDTTGPVPTLTITSDPGATHTNSITVSYMVTFDMDVTGFDRNDIEVEGSADGGNPEVSVFAGSGDTYTFVVERGDSDGNVIVFIPADMAIDGSGNQNVASDRLEIIFDTISPTLTLASTESGDTRLRTIPVNVTFSERVDDFDADDIIIEGSAITDTPVTDDNILYMFDIVAIADGDVTVSIRENAVQDMADNGNAASGTIAFAVDTVRPIIDISTTADLLTNLESISYAVTFRESVNGFTATDISASIAGSTPTVMGPVLTIGNTQTYIIAHGVNEGVLMVSIPENVATDDAGNNNTASNILVHTIDRIAPTITDASVLDTDTIRLVMSETVSDNSTTISDFAISGVVSSPAVDSIAVSGSTVDLNLDDFITDTDAPRIAYSRTDGSIDDLAENPLADFANQIATNNIDTTAPMPTLATVSPPLTNSQTIAFTVDFGEIVTGFDDTSGIRVTGTSGAAASAPTGSGRNYDFTVNRGSSDGTVIVTILAGAARDGDDNLSAASGEITITIDTTPPTVTGATVSDTDTIILDISEPVSDDSATASDFVISGVATNPAVSSITVSGSTVTLDLNRLITDADVPLVSYTRTAGSINDTAKNPLADFANEPATNDIDTTRPSVTAFTTTSSNPTNSQTITYNVQFSESVTGFSAAGIGVTGTSGGTANEPTGAGRDYEFTVTRGISDGTVTVTIMEGAARDADDNLSFASSPVEVTVDATPPTVTGAEVLNPNIIRLDLSEPISDNNAVASDFAIAGAASNPAASSIAVSGSSIELSLTPSLTDADNPTVSYTRTTGGIEDPATNRLADFANQAATNDIDTTAPVPTLSTDIDSPTNLAVIPYMVVFTEDVSGFDRSGIDASIDGATLTASNPVTNDDITYTFTVTHNVNEGELRVSIRAGAATDMDSNTNTASNTISRMIDRIAPTVTGATASDTDTIILEISEPVSGGAASDFTISGVATNPSVSSIGITGNTITLDLNGLITDADSPLISYTGTVDIEDAAENRLADFANQMAENNLDTTRPVPTLTITSEPGAVTHTNSPTVSYMVEFDMDVVGFIEGDIMVEGSANNGNPETSNFVTVDDATYTFDVERNNSDGNVIVSIPENRATDLAGNQNVASDRLEITFDTVSPTLMFASTESGDTKLRTIPFTVRFDEVVSGFDRNDIIIEGAATARQPTTSDEIFYEFDLVATSDGPVTVSIRENAARDMADNGNAASGMITLTVDTGRVRADLSTDIDSPTNLATIPYTVDFGEQVSGFTAADIDASVDGTPVTASMPVVGAGNTYTFGVTHNVLEGEVTVSIMAGAVMDGAENTNDASNSITLTVERIAPTVTAASVSDTNTIVLNISEFVSGGVASDFTVTGVASIPAVSSIDIADNMIMLTLDGFITDADNPVISYIETDGIEDLAENRLAAFANQMVANNLDTTAPEPTLSTTASLVTSAVRLPFMVVFDMDVRGFDEDDIVLEGTASARIDAFEGTGASYTFDVNRRSSGGTITVSIPENIAQDFAGNNNTASNTITITIDTDRPLPVVIANTTSFTNGPAILYTVVFDMPVNGFNATGINVGGTANGRNPEASGFEAVNSTAYTFEVVRGSSDGTVRVQVRGEVAQDAAENPNAASVPLTVTFDTVAPAATGGRVTGPDIIRLAMSEPISDSSAAAFDFTVSGVASVPAVSSISISGGRMNLFLDGIIEESDLPTVSYVQTSGNINDRATNPLADFADLAVTNDGFSDRTGDPGWRTKPTFGSSHITGDPIVSCGYSIDGRCTDVLDYHVNYTRQTIQTNSTHDFALKTYAQRGVKQFELAFGVPDIGAPINNAEAVITIDLVRNYTEPSTHSIDKISYANKNNVIGQNATFAVSQVKCLPADLELDCIRLDITGVLFREEMYHVPFAIHATDYKLRGTINYLNEGILVQGETLNELPVVTRSTKSASQSEPLVIQLTRTDKLSDVWTDQFGDTWTKNEWDTWRYVDRPTPSMVSSCRDIDNRLCDAFSEKLDWHTTNMERLRDSLYGKIYTEPAFDDLKETIIIFGAGN